MTSTCSYTGSVPVGWNQVGTWSKLPMKDHDERARRPRRVFAVEKLVGPLSLQNESVAFKIA